ncbi:MULTISPECIES: glycosyltransferase family 39 protein [Streptacidiphilus]|uniref:ArnT family glycosyltransferase n=1 Tax=Streptacidiphilus cavernicola TaxID=3342716 RepID=A0ABV6UG77_9ACTN|nr:glycosyltransferase family 39 protein [Streptacidiphilus jeojiense]
MSSTTAAQPVVLEQQSPAGDPRWVRPAFIGLLLVTAVLYLWDLSASGWANQFYSAAVQAGSKSWEAMFYGSSDAANFITVDKPPASLWVMDVSARIFGVNSWSILAPQALEGVATVAVVYAAVRRRFSAQAGLIAGAVLALTPVAALMFRFNNPDALLALLLTLAGYAVLRAQEQAQTRWLVLAGACVGLAFLTKTLQAFLILPALGATYLAFAPTGMWRRIRQVLVALVVMVVSGGWWVAVVQLTPPAYRPYIGGSQHNSFLELTFGYNGFGRLDGSETGSVGGGGGGAGGSTGMWGSTGLTRLFGSDMGGQIAWLLPAALLLLVAGLWLTWRLPRVDSRRAAFVLWGLALVATFLTFSLMKGIFHPYYNVALAPYIAILVGMGAGLLWEHRRTWFASVTLAVVTGVTAVLSYTLLERSSDWYPWLRYAVLIGGMLAALGLIVVGQLPDGVARPLAALGLVAVLAGPAAYTLQTVGTAHSGSLPSAGPAVAAGFGGGGGFGGGAGGGRGGGGFPGGGQAGATGGQGGPQAGGTGGFPGGGTAPGGTAGGRTGAGTGGGTGGGFGGGAGGAGGVGTLLNGSDPGTAITALLKADASKYTWAAAAIGSQNAAGYQLATGDPVMALGGFNGTDAAPSLSQFEQYVRSGRIHYFIGGGTGANGSSGSSDTSQISTWVAAHYASSTVDGVTVYDLTKAKTTTTS